MNIAISSESEVYQIFNRNEALRDPATGIELELSALFQ